MKTVLDVGTGNGEFILDAYRTCARNFYIGIDVVKGKNWLSAYSLNEYFVRKFAGMMLEKHLYKTNIEKRVLERLAYVGISLEEACDQLKSLKSDLLYIEVSKIKQISYYNLFGEELEMYYNERSHKIRTRIAKLFSESLIKKVFMYTFGEFLSRGKPVEMMKRSLNFLSSVQLIIADGRYLPFRAQSIDIVVSFGLHKHGSPEKDEKLSEELKSEIEWVLKDQDHQIVDQKAYINQPNVDLDYWIHELLEGRLNLNREKEIEEDIKRQLNI